MARFVVSADDSGRDDAPIERLEKKSPRW